MNNFHYAKIITGVGPLLAKETVLSKIINMVDVFRITLSQGFDDNNKKYIETILKLDNSKTIMLETKGTDIRVKNLMNITLKKNETIIVDYSEYAQESDKKIFIDCPFLTNLPNGTQIRFMQSNVLIEIKNRENDYVIVKVLQGGEIMQYDRVIIEEYERENLFLSHRDRKDIMRWLEYGVHMIWASMVRTDADVFDLKMFLKEQRAEKMKVFAKIETKSALQNYEKIVNAADGIILVADILEPLYKATKTSLIKLVETAKDIGKPVFITIMEKNTKDAYALTNEKYIKQLCDMAIDGFMTETMITEDDPVKITTDIFDLLEKYGPKFKKTEILPFYEKSDFLVRDYILYNAFRTTQELPIKAIVCYTENGYTTAKLASLNPSLLIIAFTPVDETYRYLNTLRWVRGYKISQSFSYENLKRVGKEMIRIIFKGNISLDDLIIIVQANETNKEDSTDMINGVEIHKFKNI